LNIALVAMGQNEYNNCPEHKFGIDSLNSVIEEIIPNSVLEENDPVWINLIIEYGQWEISSIDHYKNGIVKEYQAIISASDFNIPEYDFNEVSLKYVYPYYYATCHWVQIDTDYDDGFMTKTERTVSYFEPWSNVDLNTEFFNHREVDSTITFQYGWDSARSIVKKSLSEGLFQDSEMYLVNFHLRKDGKLEVNPGVSSNNTEQKFKPAEMRVIESILNNAEHFIPAMLREKKVNSLFAIFIRNREIFFLPMEKPDIY
jgi:hypothetical protein